MNRSPLTPITAADIETYARDGVVCLRRMFDRDWIDRLLAAWERARSQLKEHGGDQLLPQKFLDRDPLLAEEMRVSYGAEALAKKDLSQFLGGKYMRLWDPDFRAFVHESPAGEIVGRVLGANQIRFYWDQIFHKPAGSTFETYWHNDQATWPTRGEQLPSLWLPLTPISEDQSLEYIPGTHRDRTDYWGKSLNATRATRPADRPEFIDYETRRGDPAVRFLKWAMEPGDVMLFHPRLYHGGGPNKNTSGGDRIALSTRWMGDDIVWHPHPGAVNTPGMPLHEMVAGARPDDDDAFPVVWRRPAAERSAA
jgi:hypothetical protein